MTPDTIPYMTKDEIRKLAWEKSPILYASIRMYDYGKASWEEAMQIAAVTLADENATLVKELVRLKINGQ